MKSAIYAAVLSGLSPLTVMAELGHRETNRKPPLEPEFGEGDIKAKAIETTVDVHPNTQHSSPGHAG